MAFVNLTEDILAEFAFFVSDGWADLHSDRPGDGTGLSYTTALTRPLRTIVKRHYDAREANVPDADVRRRLAAGESILAIAKDLRISRSTLYRKGFASKRHNSKERSTTWNR